MIQWTQGTNGRLIGGRHFVRDDDLLDIEREVNLRRSLGYVTTQDISGLVAPRLSVRRAAWQGLTYPPLDSLRTAILDLLSMPPGLAGGVPPTPTALEWLWPENDADFRKVIVAGTAASGQVSLLSKLNSSGLWTDPDLTGSFIRTPHVNEMRWCLEKLRRGRWVLPIYSGAGILSLMTETGWYGGAIANSIFGQLHALAHATVRGDGVSGTVGQGLVNVSVQPESIMNVATDQDCVVGFYQLLRDINWVSAPGGPYVPTWTKCNRPAGALWNAPGATGSGDSLFIGQATSPANGMGSIAGSDLASSLQSMVDGQVSHFLFTRIDQSYETVSISAELLVEFELNN